MNRDSNLLPQNYKVLERRRETKETATLTLAPLGSAAGMEFGAGQFCMLYLFGMGEVPISISGRGKAGRVQFTIRNVGAITERLSELKKGEIVGVRGPFGNGWPIDEFLGRDLIILGGGVGLAPLRMLIHETIRRREMLKTVTVFYGGRTPADLLFVDELEAWKEKIMVGVTVDVAPASWHGPVGLITELLARHDFDPGNTAAVMCGPEIMMKVCVAELRRRGVPLERLYLAMERNMKCAIAFCGHCQFGPSLICRDGPVHSYASLKTFFETREI